MSRTYKPGQRAPASGIYTEVGPRGGRSGEVIVTRGKPLPPTHMPGGAYVLHERVKEGRSGARTQVSIANTRSRFGPALKNLAKR